jgi:hypothetical protein
LFCFYLFFACFFNTKKICLIKNDHTGQGLVGMMLIAPLFWVCILGLSFLLLPKIKKEFM